DQPYRRRKLALPTYPFQRQTYWVDGDTTPHPSSPGGARQSRRGDHELLGCRLYSAALEQDTLQFEAQIQQKSPDYLADHRVFDHPVMPASAWLEMALAAAPRLFGSERVQVEDLTLEQGLMLEPSSVLLQTLVHPQEDGSARLEMFSRPVSESADTTAVVWTRHATGRLVKAAPTPADGTPAPAAPTDGKVWGVQDYYARLQHQGLQYGPAFQTIRQLTQTSTALWGQVALSESEATSQAYHLHPALLDGCFQLVGAMAADLAGQDTYLPMGVKRLRLVNPGQSRVTAWVTGLVPHGSAADLLMADLVLYDGQGQLVAEVEGLQLRRTSRDRLLQALQPDISRLTYTLAWRPQPLSTPAPPEALAGNWLVLVDDEAIAAALQAELAPRDGRWIRVRSGSTYTQVEGNTYIVNPQRGSDFRQLFQALADQPLRGIIHLWSLSAPPVEITTLADSQRWVCGSTLHLLQGVLAQRRSPQPQLWLVTQQAQAVTPEDHLQLSQAALWGLGRVIALEHPELRSVRVDLSSPQDIPALVQELATSGREDQVAYRQGQRYVARLERSLVAQSGVSDRPTALATEGAVQLKSSGKGILDDLTWVPQSRQAPGPGEVEIRVRATGLNFRDVLNALGMLKAYLAELGLADTDIPFGGECSGEVVAVGEGVTELGVGDGVIAALAIGSLGSYVTVPARLVVPKPESLSFEEAATLSTAFLTAYYGLCHLAQLQPGDRVLIHAAAGGVGQAAVQIAQWRGAEVYATASPAKWEVLRAMGVQGVMNSRSLEFADELMALTQGRGVDVVLNSLTGDFIPASLSVLAPQGRFVEIGKIGIWTAAQVAAERPDGAYFPFDLLEVAQHDPNLVRTMLQTILEQFGQGHFSPLPHQSFPLERSVEAFRFMAQAKHIGKVVITQPAEPTEAMATELPIRSDATYLITGGLGGLGLTVAQWLVEQGARHLVLTRRREVDSQAEAAIAALQAQG
ncbi:MAG TPA: polyketide synthase dehydratase domain-containing protein, partial [Leptolyngbyaceae cyanobacterium M65_K2018_010]|nr:polyketide synthase dehydratase domain-containing protein [Leptolyngbyaceae cyanobacterium M65_K2018_010]